MPDKYLSNRIHELLPKVTGKGRAHDHADLEDLSYEDALLDVEIRSFMRSEYGKQEPPSGIFPRIMQSMRLYREEQAKAAMAGSLSGLQRIAGRIGQALAAASNYAARQNAGRMVSGSLLTGLLVLAALPGIARTLSNGGGLSLAINGLLAQPDASISAEYDYQTGVNPVESATSTSAPQNIAPPPPSAQGAPQANTDPRRENVSPGRLYEDPRLLIAQRTGEDPNQLKPHLARKSSTGNAGTSGPSQAGREEEYNRPITGQY